MLSESDRLVLELDTSLKSQGIRRRERDSIQTELKDYFETSVAEKRAGGMSPEEAERCAVKQFGPLEPVVSAYVDDWRRRRSTVRRRVIAVPISLTAFVIAILVLAGRTQPQEYAATAYAILADFNGANASLDRLGPWMATDSVFEEAPTGQLAVGRPQALRAIARWKRAFPDARGEIVDVVQRGDHLRVKIRWTGTQTGPLTTARGTFRPTGRRVSLPAVVVLTMHDGKIARLDHTFDLDALLDQIG